jgi:hypothetical protein
VPELKLNVRLSFCYRQADKNLFPARPFFTFWYPPYASQQPRVDASGTYTIDFSKLTDKPMAVVKMDLQGAGLQLGKTYAVSFAARAEPADALTLNLPEAAGQPPKPRSDWLPLAAKFRQVRQVFRYDPKINDG